MRQFETDIDEIIYEIYRDKLNKKDKQIEKQKQETQKYKQALETINKIPKNPPETKKSYKNYYNIKEYDIELMGVVPSVEMIEKDTPTDIINNPKTNIQTYLKIKQEDIKNYLWIDNLNN